jgi:hypothetical protein
MNDLELVAHFIKRDRSIRISPITDNEFTMSLNEVTMAVRLDPPLLRFRQIKCGTPSGFFEPKTIAGRRLFLLDGEERDALNAEEAAKHLIGLLKNFQQTSS